MGIVSQPGLANAMAKEELRNEVQPMRINLEVVTDAEEQLTRGAYG